MTHQEDSAVLEAVTAILIEHGPAAMASAYAILMNCAMQIEREQTLKAESHSVGRPSRLRQRIQAEDPPHSGGRGAPADPADPRLPRR